MKAISGKKQKYGIGTIRSPKSFYKTYYRTSYIGLLIGLPIEPKLYYNLSIKAHTALHRRFVINILFSSDVSIGLMLQSYSGYLQLPWIGKKERTQFNRLRDKIICFDRVLRQLWWCHEPTSGCPKDNLSVDYFKIKYWSSEL